jgi:hypothetical protein
VSWLLLIPALLAGGDPGPSRPAEKGCVWEKASDAGAGLEAWVQRCDFGFRKIDLGFKGRSLVVHYSDGGSPIAVVDVFDLVPGESVDAGIKRVFLERTPKDLAARCRVAPYHGDDKPPKGVERFTFIPDPAYQKELDAKGPGTGVPDPPCGDWGESPDGIGYFEAQPARGVPRVLFVRVGQDTPLFDEKTLRILPAR